jgi:chromosome segregation ATPase
MALILGTLFGPVGRVVLLIAAFGWWTIYQRTDAARDARAECQAEQMKRTLDEIERQRDAAQQAVADAEKREAVADREMADLEIEKNQLAEKARNAEESCKFHPDSVRDLNRIR